MRHTLFYTIFSPPLRGKHCFTPYFQCCYVAFIVLHHIFAAAMQHTLFYTIILLPLHGIYCFTKNFKIHLLQNLTLSTILTFNFVGETNSFIPISCSPDKTRLFDEFGKKNLIDLDKIMINKG